MTTKRITPIRVVQIGDVASVAPALAAAAEPDVVMSSVDFRQFGAKLRGPAKAIPIVARLSEALRTARRAKERGPDVVHIHWVPNGVTGLFIRGRPWVVHCHGSDIRSLSGPRLRLARLILRRAAAVAYSTPDLEEHVGAIRDDAHYIPTPIVAPQARAAIVRDVLIASRGEANKGSATVAEAIRILKGRLPSLSAAGIEGRDFQAPADVLPFMAKDRFFEEIASSRVILGQFQLSALGISELEAMAMEKPVVTSVDLSLYAQPPPVISARDPGDIARAVDFLLGHPSEAAGLGRAARAWVERYHSPEAVRSLLVSFYLYAMRRTAGGREIAG